MSLRLFALCFCLPSVLGASSASFDQLKQRSETLGSLSQFLDSYVGDCSEAGEGILDCQRNAKSFRRSADGKRFYLMVDEAQLSVAQIHSDGTVDFNLTPFFPANGSALTHGAPTRTDPNGNPVLPFIKLRATAPQGESGSTLARWAGLRNLSLQMVFTPKGTWRMGKKGGGVRAQIEGIQVIVTRTGQSVGSWP